MRKIRIIAAPPSFAPEHIRKEWVGMEFPTMEGMDDGSGLRTGTGNAGGYKISTDNIRLVIQEKGSKEFFEFWKPYLNATHFVFKKEVCEEI